MKELIPLQKSHSYNQVEFELKQLMIRLFQKHLANPSADINCYGMPHLGSKDLLHKYLVAQNISNFNVGSLSEDSARYLVSALRFKNLKRGTHLLATFLICAWGTDFEISPLYQHKDKPYPQELKTAEEIQENRENGNDYFLTSRLRVILYGTEGYFSTEIAKSLNQILPARLFVHEVSRVVTPSDCIRFGHAAFVETTYEANGLDFIEIFERNHASGWVNQATLHSIVTGFGTDE